MVFDGDIPLTVHYLLVETITNYVTLAIAELHDSCLQLGYFNNNRILVAHLNILYRTCGN